jgi:hypothetical protein
MSTKTMYLAIIGAVAAAPIVHASPTATPHLASGVVAENGTMPGMSGAARDQLLSNPSIHAATQIRAFGQAGRPWMQSRWVGQMKL